MTSRLHWLAPPTLYVNIPLGRTRDSEVRNAVPTYGELWGYGGTLLLPVLHWERLAPGTSMS